ncbi:methyltransferase [Marinoscillum sp.]|uniref:methyltransferase n=1 Tax=Marinoscillum sp. TaxID=2024838 RepID=UPI003BAABAA9
MTNVKLTIKRIIKRLISGPPEPKFRESNHADYLNAYADFVDKRVARDPHEAIGGYWEELGPLQLEFLKDQGLQASHSVLDIGCGTLRGGRLIMAFLDTGNYMGYDISQAAVTYAQELIDQEDLNPKKPRVFWTMQGLAAPELRNMKFDVLWAQSVFTHLGPDYIAQHFAQCGDLMHEFSKFYFTYEDADQFKVEREVDFAYPYSFFEDLARQFGFRLRDLSAQYPHPRGQRILELRKSI